MARLIVRDGAVLAGRWRIEDTTISVAMIREDAQRMGRTEVIKAYNFMDLTTEELDSVMHFDFPELRSLTINPVYSSLLVECVCGEETPQSSKGAVVTVPCICGRTWRVVLQAQVLSEADEVEPAALAS